MSAPDRIDPNAIQWSGPLGEAQNKDKNVEARTENTEAGTAKTRTEIPLIVPKGKAEISKIEADTEGQERKNILPNLTPGEEETDKRFAEDYKIWRAMGDYGTANESLRRAEKALDKLRTSDTISGPVIGRSGELIRQIVNEDSLTAQTDIEKNIVMTLRPILGAQFTQQEGEALVRRTYDPRLSEQANIEKVESLIRELRSKAIAKEAAARFWEEKVPVPGQPGVTRPRGTLSGFAPDRIKTVQDEYDATEQKQRGGYTPEQTAAIHEYIASDGFTPEGYADLNVRIARENGGTPDAQFYKDALEAAREVQQRRASGKGFGPGVEPRQSTVPEPPAEPEKPDISLGGAAWEGFKNIPGSLWNNLSGAAKGIAGLQTQDIPGTENLSPMTRRLLDTTLGPMKMGINLGDIGGKMLASATGAAGLSDVDPRLAQMTGKYFGDRYGSWNNIKHTLAEDPVGLLMDASVPFTGGGTAAIKGGAMAGKIGALARAGEALGTAGRVVRNTGRLMDPVSGAVGAAEGLGKLASKYAPENVMRTLGVELPAGLVSMPSGMGAETVKEAAGAGWEKGVAGRTTPRTAAFRGQQRNIDPIENITDQFANDVTRLRDEASARYTRDIEKYKNDATYLPFEEVETAIAKLKPRHYDIRANGPKAAKTSTDKAWDAANDAVVEYRAALDQNPELATPFELDTFKQDLRNRLRAFASDTDRAPLRIATNAYNAVRGVISKHAEGYSKVMRDYSEAQDLLDQAQRSLTTKGNIDSSIRKLQSVLKRNDPGYAGKLLDTIDASDRGATTHLRAAIAGRSAEPLTPEGFRRALAGAGAGIGGLLYGAGNMPFEWSEKLAGLVNPAYMIPVAMMSPRATGSAVYGGALAAGTAKRYGSGMADMYNKYPGTALAGIDIAKTGNAIDEEEQRKIDLLKRYGLDLPYLTGKVDPLAGYAAGTQ